MACVEKSCTGYNQSAKGLIGRIDDRLFVHIEAGVHQHRQAGSLMEPAQHSKIQWIAAFPDNLRTCRPVDMHNGGDAVTPGWVHRACDRHKPRRVGVSCVEVKYLRGILFQHDWREWHEFGTVEALVDGIIYLPRRPTRQNGSVAERPRPVFHAAGVDGYDLAGDESIHGLADVVAAVAHDIRVNSGRSRELVVIASTQVHVVKEMAPALPR